MHNDHLGTPRAVTDQDQVRVWAWQSEPFGDTPPQAVPDADGIGFTFNLRFPGQYFDEETGLHYNYFRDYDPEIGRYVQSDPIGLEGGMNPYVYVDADPIKRIDPQGHFAANAAGAVGGAVFGGMFGFFSELAYQYGRCDSLRQIDWWSVAGATAVGSVGGAITGATFGATVGVSVGTGAVAGMGLGHEAGLVRGLVEYQLNPDYPDPSCGCGR